MERPFVVYLNLTTLHAIDCRSGGASVVGNFVTSLQVQMTQVPVPMAYMSWEELFACRHRVYADLRFWAKVICPDCKSSVWGTTGASGAQH
jgi:hypothetical protein